MHLSTLVSSLVLASVVSASSQLAIAGDVAHLAVRSPLDQDTTVGAKSVKMMCAGGCGGFGGGPINAALGFQQPMIFNNGPLLSNFATFGTACGATLPLWQGATFQLVQMQFSMMIISMSTTILPFQNGCGVFCTQVTGPAFLQTITQVILQVQALVQLIFTQFPGQIGAFNNQFQAMSIWFQTVAAIGLTVGLPIPQIFGGQFNVGLFQQCGFTFNQGVPFFGGVGMIRARQIPGFGPSFFFGHISSLGGIISPLVQLLAPVTFGLGRLLTGLGFTLEHIL